MSKFSVGEIVRVFPNEYSASDQQARAGQCAEVVSIDPQGHWHDARGTFYGRDAGDYLIKWPDGVIVCAEEAELRKLPPDAALPASITTIFSTKQRDPDKRKETV